MNYEQLIETLSELVENEKIYKTGLILVYELEEKNHKQMNEQLFYKSNPATAKFVDSDLFEVEISGILVRFIKKAKPDLQN
jgi:hypothetical protein